MLRKIVIFLEAPKSESEAMSASSKHRSCRIPEEFKPAVDVIEVERVDDLRHWGQNGHTINIVFCGMNFG